MLASDLVGCFRMLHACDILLGTMRSDRAVSVLVLLINNVEKDFSLRDAMIVSAEWRAAAAVALCFQNAA